MNKNDGVPIEKTYTVNGGCADYKYLEQIWGAIENEVKDNVTMYANSEDQIICKWVQGGTIGVNNWAYSSTKEARLILEDGNTVVIPNTYTVSNLPSNPVSCKI